MYQPGGREYGWRHLGEQDEIYEDFEYEDGDVSFNLFQGVDNNPQTTYTTNSSLNNMSKQEELNLIRQSQSGCIRSQKAVLDKYALLCHKLARKFGFTAPNFDHEDLFQEAQIGLLSALQTYQSDKGASFMTWAFYAIRGAVVSAGKTDRKQPRYPVSLETSARAYNIEDPRVFTVKDDLPVGLATLLIEECAGGMHTKRAKIICDRYGLLGHPELRNCEAAKKYGISKNAIVSHTYNFKKKVRAKFPELARFV